LFDGISGRGGYRRVISSLFCYYVDYFNIGDFIMKKIIFTIMLTLFIQADNNQLFTFKDDYQTALKEAKKGKRYLFVLITRKNCGWCNELKRTTLKEPEIKEGVSRRFVTVELDKHSKNYPKSLRVNAVPIVLIIDSRDEKIVTAIVGFHKDKRDYTKWFNYIDNLED